MCGLYLYKIKKVVMYKEIGSFLAEELEQIKKDGLFKSERVISGPRGQMLRSPMGRRSLIFVLTTT